MARHVISFSPTGRKAMQNVFINDANQPLVFLEEGETGRIVLDFTDYLDTSETVSSATVENDNITVTRSVSSPKVTLTASGAGAFGKTDVTVTFSTGDIIVQTIEIRNRVQYRAPARSDYPPA